MATSSSPATSHHARILRLQTLLDPKPLTKLSVRQLRVACREMELPISPSGRMSAAQKQRLVDDIVAHIQKKNDPLLHDGGDTDDVQDDCGGCETERQHYDIMTSILTAHKDQHKAICSMVEHVKEMQQKVHDAEKQLSHAQKDLETALKTLYQQTLTSSFV